MIGVLRVFVESDGVLQASYGIFSSVFARAALKVPMRRRSGRVTGFKPLPVVVVATSVQEFVLLTDETRHQLLT